MEWLARVYVHAMNCIHYMHDKYFYERLEMALHDRDILRTMAFGIAGLSVVADSLSAIKYGKIRVIRDDKGLAVDFKNEGNANIPQFGNNDDRVDKIASELVTGFMQKIRKHPTYRNATHTQSVLTITSNVVYGKATGNTPDGRRKGEPFGPGANPMHGRDNHGSPRACRLRNCPTRIRRTASATPFLLPRRRHTCPNTSSLNQRRRRSTSISIMAGST
jgi:formate C-acetyltransferase